MKISKVILVLRKRKREESTKRRKRRQKMVRNVYLILKEVLLVQLQSLVRGITKVLVMLKKKMERVKKILKKT